MCMDQLQRVIGQRLYQAEIQARAPLSFATSELNSYDLWEHLQLLLELRSINRNYCCFFLLSFNSSRLLLTPGRIWPWLYGRLRVGFCITFLLCVAIYTSAKRKQITTESSSDYKKLRWISEAGRKVFHLPSFSVCMCQQLVGVNVVCVLCVGWSFSYNFHSMKEECRRQTMN